MAKRSSASISAKKTVSRRQMLAAMPAADDPVLELLAAHADVYTEIAALSGAKVTYTASIEGEQKSFRVDAKCAPREAAFQARIRKAMRSYRENHGLLRQAVADRLQISLKDYAAYETYRFVPPALFIHFCNLTETPIDRISSGDADHDAIMRAAVVIRTRCWFCSPRHRRKTIYGTALPVFMGAASWFPPAMPEIRSCARRPRLIWQD